MLILVLLAGLVLMRESRQEPLASWDDRWADFLATTSRQAQREAPVTLVGIDDSEDARRRLGLASLPTEGSRLLGHRTGDTPCLLREVGHAAIPSSRSASLQSCC